MSNARSCSSGGHCLSTIEAIYLALREFRRAVAAAAILASIPRGIVIKNSSISSAGLEPTSSSADPDARLLFLFGLLGAAMALDHQVPLRAPPACVLRPRGAACLLLASQRTKEAAGFVALARLLVPARTGVC
jgi:hypothetical protein